MASQAAKANASLDLSGKTAAVSGGTQGIGAGVALRFAQLGCSRVLIVGRNEERGAQMVERLREAAAAASASRASSQKPFDADFIKGDLSTAGGIRDTADRLAKRTEDSIDYLVLTSGAPPAGLYKPNADGLDTAFTTQCLGRFGLSYLLAARGALNDGGAALSVGSPGPPCKSLNLDDLDLGKAYGKGRLWPLFILDQGVRDGTVLDGVTEELNARYPKIRFYHVFPGLIGTNSLANAGYPWPIAKLGQLASPLIPWIPFLGNSVEGYAEIPVYITANPEAQTELKGETRLTQRLKPVALSAWNKEVENRKKLFSAMQGLLGVPS